MKIVNRRLNSVNNEDYENPEFLQTIRMPKDAYYLTENLPKPNYFSPKLADHSKTSHNKTVGKSCNHSQASKLNMLPKVSGQHHNFAHNRSLLIRNQRVDAARVVEAARAEMRMDKEHAIKDR